MVLTSKPNETPQPPAPPEAESEAPVSSDFFKSKFDNLSLFVLIILLVGVMVYADRLSSDKLAAWLEQTVTTVLGAYIGLTQAHRVPWLKGGDGKPQGK